MQHDGSVREREEAPLRVETSVLDSLYVREEIEENVEGSSDEEDNPSLKQYEANISRAERTPFRQIMTQRTETMSQEEFEDQQLREALDSTHSIVKDIKARRERERREQDEESFPLATSTRVMNTVMTRSRTDSVGGARAHHRSASLSSSGTGYGYDSGPETECDYQSAEESAPPPGKSIMVPQPGKIDVDNFIPSGMENFKKVCKLVSDGNHLEDKVRQHFKAQYKDTKASAYDLQSKYYKTELSICQEALNRELQSLAKESESQKI